MFRKDQFATAAKTALVRLVTEQLREDHPHEVFSTPSSSTSSLGSSDFSGGNFHQKMKRMRMEKNQEVIYLINIGHLTVFTL